MSKSPIPWLNRISFHNSMATSGNAHTNVHFGVRAKSVNMKTVDGEGSKLHIVGLSRIGDGSVVKGK